MRESRLKLAVVCSHPIQYYAPLFRALARETDLTVFFCHRQSAGAQAAAGFGVAFEWDVDLMSGYQSEFLDNVSARPNVSTFGGCDTPDIGERLRQGFDAVLLTGWHLKCHWQAVLACRRLKVPVMVRGDSRLGTRRGSAKLAVKKLLYPRMLRLFAACAYVGQDSRAYYLHYGVPDERLYFSPHTVDNARFSSAATLLTRDMARQRLGVSPEAYIILFAGKVLTSKRPFDLVRAAALMQASHPGTVQVLVAGDGPARNQLEAAALEAQVVLRVLGFRNQSEMPAVYRAADVLVLPSEETWGLVANEALACGVPVVASNACGCARDLLLDGRAGRVYPFSDIPALAQALSAVREAPPSAGDINARANEYAPERAAAGIVAAGHAVVDEYRRAASHGRGIRV